MRLGRGQREYRAPSQAQDGSFEPRNSLRKNGDLRNRLGEHFVARLSLAHRPRYRRARYLTIGDTKYMTGIDEFNTLRSRRFDNQEPPLGRIT